MCRSQILQIVSLMKISYTAEGSSTEYHFVLLVVASKSSKDPIDKLEALLVSFLFLLTRKKTISEVQKKNNKVNRDSKGKQKHHKVFLLLMNIDSSDNFGINKRLGLKSPNSTQPGHILEKKGSVSYEKNRFKKGTFFPFSRGTFFSCYPYADTLNA